MLSFFVYFSVFFHLIVIIFISYCPSHLSELAADPSSVEYNQALGLQGSLADVTIKLQDTAQTPVQYIGDVTALFAVLNGSQGIVGMDLRLIGPLQRDVSIARILI